jgi:hypothetical protein
MSVTAFTGPVLAGNVLNSDGTGTLAGLGGSSGQQNLGFCEMVQAQAVTQATNGTSAGVFTTTIVIPANSFITGIDLFVATAWSGGASTLGIGTTVSATALTTAGAVAGGTLGKITVAPGTSLTQINNWLNVGNTDVEIVVTSTNTGTGAGTLVVRYAQAFNAYSVAGNITY